DGYAGANLMHAVAEPAQDLPRLFQVTRLSNHFPFQGHQSVSCKHHRIQSLLGDDTRFAPPIGDGELAQRQMWRREFIHLSGYDFQSESGSSEQAAPPRRM